MSENVVQHDLELLADGGAFDPKKYSHNPDLHFRNISNEAYRIYIYPPTLVGQPNNSIRVENPEAVSCKAPERTFVGGGSHRVVDKSGVSFYIPAGWIGITWEPVEGVEIAYRW